MARRTDGAGAPGRVIRRRCRGRLDAFNLLPQRGDDRLQRLELGFLAGEEFSGEPQLGDQPLGREQIGVGGLAVVPPKILDLDEALVQQRMEQVVRLPQAEPERIRQLALGQLGPIGEKAQGVQRRSGVGVRGGRRSGEAQRRGLILCVFTA